jgi:hypothetical protein
MPTSRLEGIALSLGHATLLAAAHFSRRLGASAVEAVAAGIANSPGIHAVFHLALGLTLAKGPLGFRTMDVPGPWDRASRSPSARRTSAWR